MSDMEEEHAKGTVRLCKMDKCDSYGFHLTRTKWDPYPWVCGVDDGSQAELAGLQVGDCVLEVNGSDVVGWKISEIAENVSSITEESVEFLLWNSGKNVNCDAKSLCCAPMPKSLSRLSTCLGSILSYMECPICFDVICPPAHQCPLGHLICFKCRVYSVKCPMCRTKLGRDRSLLADHTYESLVEAFELKMQRTAEMKSGKLWECLFGAIKGKNRKENVPELRNKFLTRVIGKSSSLDNISSFGRRRRRDKNVVSESGYMSSLGRKKSLSTNEINLAQLEGNFPSASSVASESIGSIVNHSSMVESNANPTSSEKRYHCPICGESSYEDFILGHLVRHGNPILQIFQPTFLLKFPLSIPNLNVVVVFYNRLVILVRVVEGEEGLRFKIGAAAERRDLRAKISVHGSGDDTKFTFKTRIEPLNGENENGGVFIAKGTLESYFRNIFSVTTSIYEEKS